MLLKTRNQTNVSDNAREHTTSANKHLAREPIRSSSVDASLLSRRLAAYIWIVSTYLQALY